MLNTNTYSIATTLLQEKVDRLEKEKADLLNSRNLENDKEFRNRFNNNKDVNHINNVHYSDVNDSNNRNRHVNIIRNNFTREESNQ